MAETIQKELNLIEQAISDLENALPQIIGISTNTEGNKLILKATESIKNITFDPDMKSLAITLKILCNVSSSALKTVVYQAYITEILEMLVDIKNKVKKSGFPKTTNCKDLQITGEFLIRFAGRITNRYKINVQFSPDYEAKLIRAFMVVKELHEVCRFFSMDPDLTMNDNANLDNGFEIDVLSQESAEELHRRIGSVLEVQSIQIFTETMNQQVLMLDPPHIPNNYDSKVEEFLNN